MSFPNSARQAGLVSRTHGLCPIEQLIYPIEQLSIPLSSLSLLYRRKYDTFAHIVLLKRNVLVWSLILDMMS